MICDDYEDGRDYKYVSITMERPTTRKEFELLKIALKDVEPPTESSEFYLDSEKHTQSNNQEKK